MTAGERSVHTRWQRLARRVRARVRGAGLALALALVLGVPAGAQAAEPAGRPLNLWPFYDERDDPVERAHYTGGLGPLVLSGRSQDGAVEELALRPLFYRREDKVRQVLEWEALYPLLTYSRHEEDWEFQFLQLLSARNEGSRPTERERRADFFPFYLSGTTEEGEEYRAVLPFGGRALNRLGQDELEFVLFPLYARFVKQGVETRYFPWPLVSVTRGEGGHSGFRLVPLYGQEEKPGVFEKRFALWPLFLHQRTGLDGPDPEETLALLPLYVSQRSAARERTTWLWPLFSYTKDRERAYEEWDLPWPFIKIARGEGRTITRVFPLFAVEERVLRNEFLLRELKSHDLFVLFPLYLRSVEEIPGNRKVRDRILWYLYSDTREEGTDGSTRRVDAWPFFHYTRDREGRVAFQALALLEAFMPDDEKLARNYSPLWSVYTYRRTPEGETVHSFLWNLVRQEETGAGSTVEILGPVLSYREAEEHTHFSLLGGLFAYEVRHDVRAVRLFGGRVLSWHPVPQAIATLDPAGGMQ